MNIDCTALRKALSADKTDAYFSFYQDGRIVYHFTYDSHCYEFPIDTVEEIGEIEDNGTKSHKTQLSSDLGNAQFKGVMPARELWRWIVKAIKQETIRRSR